MWKDTPAQLHARLLIIGKNWSLIGQLPCSLPSYWEIVVTGLGQQGLSLIDQVCPDLILLSVPLPDLDAYELCQELRRRLGYAVPILLLSAHEEVTEKIAGLESGADDYIAASCPHLELLARLRSALRRRQQATRHELIEVADLRIAPAARQAWRAGHELTLTKHEYDLLEVLVRDAGQVLPKELLLQRVWGDDPEVGPQVLKVYLSTLRKKLRGEVNLPSLQPGEGSAICSENESPCSVGPFGRHRSAYPMLNCGIGQRFNVARILAILQYWVSSVALTII